MVAITLHYLGSYLLQKEILDRLIRKSSYKKGAIKERIDNLWSLRVMILPMATKEIKFIAYTLPMGKFIGLTMKSNDSF